MTLIQENRLLLMLVFSLSALLVIAAFADRFKWRAKRILTVGFAAFDLIFVAGSPFVFVDMNTLELILFDFAFVIASILIAFPGYWFINWRLERIRKHKEG